MNDKLAKRLRATARHIGKAYDLPENLLVQRKADNKFTPFRGTVFNHPKSIRGVYRHLKKQAGKYYSGTRPDNARNQRPPSG